MERGNLQSTIPSSISVLSNLIFIDLDYNGLTGTLPSGLFGLSNLSTLDLNSNNLSGSIAGTENLKNLIFLQLHNNSFTGTIPLDMSNLDLLRVFNTDLHGVPDDMCAKRSELNFAKLTAGCPCDCCDNPCN